ncbi:hypothetical protein [Erwinia phage Zoomie]|uniref:Internal core protein n=1 Tax=Erwinia phage Zoomie TaxID=2851072 RepID=A0A9E6N8E6_9CAUD|nr:hypothetical protein [Erwinia phage Zoomie]
MVDFTRAPGNPAAIKANDKAGDAAGNTPMMNYDDATDNGVQSVARETGRLTAQQANVGMGQSYVAGAKASVLGGLITKLQAPDFDADVNFKATDFMANDPRVKEMRPDEDEIKWLKGSESIPEYQYRMAQIPKVRQELATAAANPISGMAGMLVADAPSMLIPFVQEGAIGRTGATALRIAADTYDVASAVYTADQLGQSPAASALVAGTGILDMTHLLQRGFGRVAVRSDRAVDDVAADAERAAAVDGNRGANNTDLNEDAARYASDTGVHPNLADDTPVTVEGKASDLTVDPDNPVMPNSTRDLDDDVATFDNIPARSVQGSVDYAELEAKAVNTNQAKAGAKVMDARAGKSLVEGIPMRPAMSRAMDRLDELASQGKLPEDFPAQYRTIMDAIADNAQDVPIHFDRKANFRAHYHPNSRDFTGEHLRLAFPKGAVGKGKMNISDVIGSMDGHELRVFLHEAIHASSSRAILRASENPSLVTPELRSALSDMDSLRAHLTTQMKREVQEGKLNATEQHYISYYLKNNHELVAGLGDNQGNYTAFLQRQTSVRGKESALRQLGKSIMRVLGMKPGARTGLTDVADALEDLLASGPNGSGLGKQAVNRMAPEFTSGAMKGMTEAARAAVKSAPAGRREEAAATAMFKQFKTTAQRFFSLRDEIAQDTAATAEFADFLVADGTKVGERAEAVADLKRLYKSEMDAVTGIVEKAITDELSRTGTGKLDQFFYRKNFVEKRQALENDLAKYLDYAHGEYRNGRPIDPPPAHIERVVNAFTESGWSERWFDHMQNAGINNEGRFEKSPYYLPRRYSSDKIRTLTREKGFAQKDFVDVFSLAMRDAYPAMDRDLSRQVARTWYQGLTSAQPKQGAMWRRAINGMSNDEFVELLLENGVAREDAAAILEKSVFASERTGSNPARNLRKRNELDMQKVYTTQSGRTMKLADIMDTDVSKLMNQYNNRMSGRVAFAAKGTPDMKDIVNQIDELRNTVAKPDDWTSKVDDTVDVLMGYPAQGATPDWMLASGYLSNAMMLKNSGLYQLTDLALAAKEFGMARVVRSMMQGGLFKHARVELGRDQNLHQRLHNILSGATQNDMRFKWLHTLADDNTDLTRSAHMVNVLRNFSQAAYSANGMRAIHRAMVNMNAGLIQDSIMAALGGSAKDAKLLGKFGLRQSALDEMRAAYAANPGAAFKPELQTHLEAVGQRFMDYVVQQNRTGETAHFAEMNPIGRVLIGYQSFAFAGTNKILRRHLENGSEEMMGGAILLAYQFPMMALMTYVRYGMDGKLDEKSSSDLIHDAVSGMSAIGGASMLMDLFSTNQRGGGVSMFGSVNSIIQTLQGVARKGEMSAQDASKLMPLAQEFIPLRILINNTSGD